MKPAVPVLMSPASAACQTTDHWFLNQGAVGLTRCIKAMLEHRGYVWPGAIVQEYAAFGDGKAVPVESMTTFDGSKESLLDLLRVRRARENPASRLSTWVGLGR